MVLAIGDRGLDRVLLYAMVAAMSNPIEEYLKFRATMKFVLVLIVVAAFSLLMCLLTLLYFSTPTP